MPDAQGKIASGSFTLGARPSGLKVSCSFRRRLDFQSPDLTLDSFKDKNGNINEKLINSYLDYYLRDSSLRTIQRRIARQYDKLISKENRGITEDDYWNFRNEAVSSLLDRFEGDEDFVLSRPWPFFMPKVLNKENGFYHFIPPWIDVSIPQAEEELFQWTQMRYGKCPYPQLPWADNFGNRAKLGRPRFSKTEGKCLNPVPIGYSYYGLVWNNEGELAFSQQAEQMVYTQPDLDSALNYNLKSVVDAFGKDFYDAGSKQLAEKAVVKENCNDLQYEDFPALGEQSLPKAQSDSLSYEESSGEEVQIKKKKRCRKQKKRIFQVSETSSEEALSSSISEVEQETQLDNVFIERIDHLLDENGFSKCAQEDFLLLQKPAELQQHDYHHLLNSLREEGILENCVATTSERLVNETPVDLIVEEEISFNEESLEEIAPIPSLHSPVISVCKDFQPHLKLSRPLNVVNEQELLIDDEILTKIKAPIVKKAKISDCMIDYFKPVQSQIKINGPQKREELVEVEFSTGHLILDPEKERKQLMCLKIPNAIEEDKSRWDGSTWLPIFASLLRDGFSKKEIFDSEKLTPLLYQKLIEYEFDPLDLPENWEDEGFEYVRQFFPEWKRIGSMPCRCRDDPNLSFLYDQWLKQQEYPSDQPSEQELREFVRQRLPDKLVQDGKVTNPYKWEFILLPSHCHDCVPLLLDPAFVKRGDIEKKMNGLSLYHYLRTHAARSAYKRLRQFFYFTPYLRSVIFPGNLKGSSMIASKKPCEYGCTWFFQDCEWHRGLDNIQLSGARKAFVRSFERERQNDCFWLSLVPWVNSAEFQARQKFGKTKIYKEVPKNIWSLPSAEVSYPCTSCNFEAYTLSQLREHHDIEHKDNVECLYCKEVFSSLDELTSHLQEIHKVVDETQCDSCDEVFSSPDQCQRHQEEREVMFYTCNKCGKLFQGSHSFSRHDQVCKAKPKRDIQEEKVSLYNLVLQFLTEHLEGVVAGIISQWNVANSFVMRFRRCLINIVMAIVNLVLNPTMMVGATTVITIVNELSSELETQNSHLINRLRETLTNVINKRLAPRAQAQPTVEQEQTVAEESFTMTFLEILKSLAPGLFKVDAMLLKARQLRVESMVRSIGHVKDLGTWFVRWLGKLYCMIQYYFFGATVHELADIVGRVDAKVVDDWVRSVNDFEVKQLSSGHLASFSSMVATDSVLQQQLYELKTLGQSYEIALSKISTIEARPLQNLVVNTNRKIQRWFENMEGSLAQKKLKHAPFMIYLYGGPGIGKTMSVDYIARALLGVAGEDYNQQMDKFQKPRNSEYWDGYNCQKVVLFDDFLQTNDNTVNVSDVGALIDLGSRAPYHLNMAACGNKAAVHFNSPLVFVTANVAPSKELIGDHIKSFGAFARRFDAVVHVTKVAEFRQGVAFDPHACRYQVEKWHTIGEDEGYFVKQNKQSLSWKEFLECLVQDRAVKERRENTCDEMSDTISFDELAKLKVIHNQILGLEVPKAQSLLDLPKRCGVAGCYAEFPGDGIDQVTQIFVHQLNMSKGNQCERMAHEMEAQRIRLILPDVSRLVLGVSLLDDAHLRLFQRTQNMVKVPSISTSPWTLEQLTYMSWADGVAIYLDFIEPQIRESSFLTRLIGWPKQKICSFFASIAESMNLLSRRVNDGFENIGDITEKTLNHLNEMYRKIGRFCFLGSLFALISGVIMLLVKWYRGSISTEAIKEAIPGVMSEGFGGSSSMRTQAKKKKVVRVEDMPESFSEGFGGSSSQRVAAKRRKMRKVLVEGAEFVVSSPILPACGKYYFRRPRAGDEVDVVVMTKGDTVYIQSSDGSTSDFPGLGPRIDPQELVGAIETHFQNPKGEARADRLQLVEKILNEGPLMEASRDTVATQAIHLLMSNLAIVRNLKAGRSIKGVFIRDRVLMVPLHVLFNSTDYDEAILRVTTQRIVDLEVKLKDSKYVVCEDKDLLFVELPQTLPAYPSLVNKFIGAGDDDWGYTDGYLVVPETPVFGEGLQLVAQKQVKSIQYIEGQSYSVDGTDMITIRKAATYIGDTIAGDCGSLLVRFDPKLTRKFLGVHVAGETGVGYATLITSEYLDSVLMKLAPKAQAVEDIKLGDIPQELFSGPQNTKLEVFGVVDKSEVPSPPNKTRISPSPLYGVLSESLTRPAKLVDFEKDGTIISPLKKALHMLEVNQIVFPEDVVVKVAENMRIKYSKLSVSPFLGERGLLSEDEVLNGKEASSWIRPYNMHTSPGYPYNLAGGKDLFIVGEEQQRQMESILKQAFLKREKAALQGVPIPSYVVDCLKDERLRNDKVDIGKTRIFSNCPLDMNLLFRKYFLRFLAHMMDHHVDWEVSVGLNVHGSDWEVLYRRLKNSGHHWIAGDYAAWDKRTPFQLAMHILPIVEDFYKRFDDYDPSHAVLRETLIRQCFTSTRIAIHNQAVLYRCHQSMPSGIPLTAVYNSIINSFLFRVVYALLAMEQGQKLSKAINSYDQMVKFVAYGDDHIARVSTIVFPWFNMKSISRKMAEFGIGYTSPDKSEIIPDELSDDNLTYLKRHFVYRAGRIDAPLPIEQVIDILSWVHAQNPKEIVEAFKMAVRSVFLELTHHSPKEFQYWYSRILSECAKRQIDIPIVSYDDALDLRLHTEVDLSLVDF